ncbi:Uncharacterised protein [Streptococcus pneumoniae]|nr:Uncharacterised protein [Streptococcus pneumoniae]
MEIDLYIVGVNLNAVVIVDVVSVNYVRSFYPFQKLLSKMENALKFESIVHYHVRNALKFYILVSS